MWIDRSIHRWGTLSLSLSLSLDRLVALEADGEEGRGGGAEGEREGGEKKRDESTSKRYRG